MLQQSRKCNNQNTKQSRQEEATRAHKDGTEALLKQIPATERNSAAVQNLVRDYGSVPPVNAPTCSVEVMRLSVTTGPRPEPS